VALPLPLPPEEDLLFYFSREDSAHRPPRPPARSSTASSSPSTSKHTHARTRINRRRREEEQDDSNHSSLSPSLPHRARSASSPNAANLKCRQCARASASTPQPCIASVVSLYRPPLPSNFRDPPPHSLESRSLTPLTQPRRPPTHSNPVQRRWRLLHERPPRIADDRRRDAARPVGVFAPPPPPPAQPLRHLVPPHARPRPGLDQALLRPRPAHPARPPHFPPGRAPAAVRAARARVPTCGAPRVSGLHAQGDAENAGPAARSYPGGQPQGEASWRTGERPCAGGARGAAGAGQEVTSVFFFFFVALARLFFPRRKQGVFLKSEHGELYLTHTTEEQGRGGKRDRGGEATTNADTDARRHPLPPPNPSRPRPQIY
jgi:hypothetical protein